MGTKRGLGFFQCVMIFSLSLLSFLACKSESARNTDEVPHEAENGAAALTYPVALKQRFVFSATLDLPEVAANRSWYCVWLMICERKGTFEYPAMLQVGLLRWGDGDSQLQPFITTEHSGQDLEFKALPGRLSGQHRFAIVADPLTVDLQMDGRSLFSAARKDFFADGSELYLKIAAEVFAVGDVVSGVVNDISFESVSMRRHPPISHAAFEDRGLRFVCDGSGKWIASGRFDPTRRFVQYDPPDCP